MNPLPSNCTPQNAGQVKTRKVYLPKGNSWVNFWTGETLDGGQTIDADAAIETIPLYVKAGSIVPMGPNIEYATESPNEIILRIYLEPHGEFKFYEDENDTYNYEKGKYSTISFKWNEKLHQLTISNRKGSFPGMQQQHLFNIVLVSKDHGADTGITDKADKSVIYDGKAVSVILR